MGVKPITTGYSKIARVFRAFARIGRFSAIDNLPASARSRMLIAVIGSEIDATINRDAGVIGTQFKVRHPLATLI